ncbi:MAG TPA: methyltransferase domain-containing protein [Anaerolineaceae bacterium]|nr:methyltransferase domain-containing protein [Anaerolineaceae bacterium]HPN51213.1 methyltransferase domain-containing protein [Anaerolineaceae bacterium]
MSMTQASSQYFEKVAGEWDSLRSGYFTEVVRQAAIDHASLRSEMSAADVGAGTGFLSAGLAPLVKTVHLLDGSSAMLDVARRNLAAFSNIRYHHAESAALPLPDGAVDAALANMYLHHCPDPQAAIREMARIVAPGGRVVITDLDTHTHAWMKEEMADVWLGFDRAQIRAWFEAAGLVNVVVDCTGQSCCTESDSDAVSAGDRSAKISVFVAAGTVPLAAHQDVKQAYGAIASEGGGCHCSCDCGSTAPAPVNDGIYTDEEMAAVPGEAAGLSLGCGNPLALAELKPGLTVVDIGSGAGMDAFLAARAVGPQGKVIGVDPTPAMLERARAAAQKHGFSQVSFREGRAEALPLEDACVDVITSNCVINLTEDKGRAFREAARVLKPGGKLVLSDMVTDRPLSMATRQNAAGWADCLNGALSEGEYLDLIRQAGLQIAASRRSANEGHMDGCAVYSLQVLAVKPAAKSCCCQ